MGLLSWIAFICLFFYLTPFLRLSTKPLRALLAPRNQTGPFYMSPYLIKVGRLEYLLGPFRDRLLSIILLTIVVYLWIYQKPLTRETLLASSLIVFFNLLAVLTIRYRDGIRLKLAEIARCHSNIHPEDFFNIFYVMMSPWPPPFPATGFREVKYSEAEYRTGETPITRYYILLEAILATSTLTRMAMLAFKRVGPEYGRDAFDGLARLWGSRVAQVAKAQLTTIGIEQIPLLEGKTLLLFNHKSTLDFALNFFALGSLHKADGRHLRPRFIAAKDHFIDNPLVYSWVGLGKVIENAGMIFINRQKGKGWAAMEEAAQKLVDTDVEIAVFPQGTRADAMQSASGAGLDAGYYSTFSKKMWGHPLGHLKRGTANLILETLINLRKQGEEKLNVLVVGVMGTANALAKGSSKMTTQAQIQFRLAPLWVLSTNLTEGIQVPKGPVAKGTAEELYIVRLEEIQRAIHQHLVAALDWHPTLIQKTQLELEKIGIDSKVRTALIEDLIAANQAGEIFPFILIDRIFSLDPSLWERFLRLYVSLQGQKPGEDSWKALLQEVSERLHAR